ncbi:Hypothetical_protein [Hexamita inflata]|uniref:Hypothetical_protein n=1 Tax=Hexamita inflata TaxID=28002 RepID=A0AA86NZC3_9EUKA|nr:Hypothetical protein HINF_LOCUS15189 [Hexamita inflata]
MYATLQNNTCVCPQFSIEINQKCTCTADKFMSMTTNNSINSCTCPKDSKLVNGTCTCPQGATISPTQCNCPTGASINTDYKCACTTGYTWGYINDGNYWCSNLKLCCSYCWGKIGDKYGCSDNEYHSSCAKSGNIVPPK